MYLSLLPGPTDFIIFFLICFTDSTIYHKIRPQDYIKLLLLCFY